MSDFYIQDGVLTDYLGPGNVSVTIPEGVTKIGKWAFRNEKSRTGYPITGAVLPEGVTEIGESAFYSCGLLASAALPKSLKTIGGYAFWGCKALASVSLPEGLESIGVLAFFDCEHLKEITIPDTVASIGGRAFSGCKALSSVALPAGLKTLPFDLFKGCASLKSVRIPEGVERIEQRAFSGCKKLELAELPASIKSIAYDSFAGCNRLAIVAPHISTKDKMWNLFLPMMLGYCANPDRYEGVAAKRYARLAKDNREAILEAAGKCLKETKAAVMAYFGVKPASRNDGPKNPYEKLSDLKKVLLLEETVLSGDMEKLEEVLTGCGKFECTARALGLACRYGSLEMVQRLAEAGATFRYSYRDSALTSKYDLYTTQRGFWGSRTIYHEFWYLLTENDLTNRDRIGDLRNIRDRLYTDGKERPPVAETERVKILRWLVPKRKALDFGCSELLHTVVVEDKPVFADALLDAGVELTNFSLDGCPEGKEIACISRMLDIARRQKYKLPVNLPLLKQVMEDTNLVARLLDEGNTESLNTTELLKSSLDAKNAGTLALCLERGYLKSKATREKLLEQCTAAGKTEHTAVLLEYINRNADLAKERAAEEAKMMKDLTAAPDSVYMMKQFWRYKKQEDGTLMITGYIGTETDVTVPEKIGKNAVTAVGSYAFSPEVPRLTGAQKEARKAIRSVTIPDFVQKVGNCAFQNCESLTSVTLPKGLKKIGFRMFSGCTAMTGIKIHSGVRQIGDYAFEGCTALRDVEFPGTLRKIGYHAFENCAALTVVTLPKGLTEVGSWAFNKCGIEKINYPKGLKCTYEWSLANLRTAIVDEGIERVAAWTFTGCEHLARVELPASVKDIDLTAFNYCPKDLVICAPAGSYAEQFAKTNFYTFEVLGQ